MSLQIDENLSFRLKRLLPPFPGCRHVEEFNLSRADDPLIHARAQTDGITILSKDDDFRALVTRLGSPPKLVFVRLGNQTKPAIAAAILAREAGVRAFLNDAESSVLELVG